MLRKRRSLSSSSKRIYPLPSNGRVRTLPASIKRAHVEDVHTLHLSKDFQTLETSRLLEIGGHGTGLSALGHKVVLASDLCGREKRVLAVARCIARARSLQWHGKRVRLEWKHTLKRLDVLGSLARLRVAVGVALDCSESPSQPFALVSIYHRPKIPLSTSPTLPLPPQPHLPSQWLPPSSAQEARDKSGALTSPHAAGEAAGRHSRARDDGAPGDGGNGAAGEHCGGCVGGAESGVVVICEC